MFSGLDTALEPNQSMKHIPFIEELLAAPTGKDKNGNVVLTTKDLSRILGKRRAVARAVNKDFTLSFFHKIFGSSKYVSLVNHPFSSTHSTFTSVPQHCSQSLEVVWMTYAVLFFTSVFQMVGSRASVNPMD
jgi:hypothetical protein